jgi:ribonucleoside-diphosphate reductase subunit M2
MRIQPCFPFRNPAVFEMYKKAVASFWSVEEVDLSQDARDWERLTGTPVLHVLIIITFDHLMLQKTCTFVVP